MRSRFLVLLAVAVSFSACKKEEAPIPQRSENSEPLPTLTTKTAPLFDAERAMEDVLKQVSFGPRVPNTSAHLQCREFFAQILRDCSPNVEIQEFTAMGYSKDTLKMANVFARFNPDAKDRILILSHWDSRPWADEDENTANTRKPVPAANDGASGAAVMLELARLMKNDPPPIGVDLLFDDGEDYGKSEVDHLQKYFMGVKHFVKIKPDYKPHVAILLDMVGDKNAEFKMEQYSVENAANFTYDLWRAAGQLGLDRFRQEVGPAIEDDHVPLIQARIKAVNIIDADLVGHVAAGADRKYWHTTDDLPKNLSASTLGQVGKLLLHLIYERYPKNLRSLTS